MNNLFETLNEVKNMVESLEKSGISSENINNIIGSIFSNSEKPNNGKVKKTKVPYKKHFEVFDRYWKPYMTKSELYSLTHNVGSIKNLTKNYVMNKVISKYFKSKGYQKPIKNNSTTNQVPVTKSIPQKTHVNTLTF